MSGIRRIGCGEDSVIEVVVNKPYINMRAIAVEN
jgi:hypothetical protein